MDNCWCSDGAPERKVCEMDVEEFAGELLVLELLGSRDDLFNLTHCLQSCRLPS
eukprot:COSAG05_NODE_3334_length_2145_cov_2.370479_2_plen_54_part_00